MADNSLLDEGPAASPGQIGRVRLADEGLVEAPPEETTPGWSVLGVIVAIVVVLVMVALLAIILWAIYKTAPI